MHDRTVRVQRWLSKLREMCEAKFPPVMHLEEDLPVLANMDFSDMELPGQYQQLGFCPDACVFVSRIGSRVSLVRRHGVSMRRLELLCSDGESRFFTVAAGQAQNLSSTDQRMMSIYRCVPCATPAACAPPACMALMRVRCRSVNWLLRKYPEARRRNLQMHTPIMVALWPAARLIQESPSMMTYGETWEHFWARHGRESDKAILHFKDRVHQLMQLEPQSASHASNPCPQLLRIVQISV
jgi:phosphatidylinositol kinase/protein kinase (PI-3  family)